MKRTALMLLASLLASGCTFKHHGVPTASPEFARADFRILGKTNHEECGTYILAIDWAHLFTNQTGFRTGANNGLQLITMNSGTPEERRSLYHALDKMPEATHLLGHRSHTTTSGVVLMGRPIFGERCSSVEARGVKIGDKPFPGIQSL